ncbi:ATP-binding cassette domain-containing protein [Robbsia andropogonis]|uniref:ATP-binding cassette domain-containing protein n=1 Tax=Robbsia andropogonis TaxID=28092 RepID=UPI002646ED63|nr:ABC transporter ATP-binding protein [Robbsia andropogonis]
MSAHADDHPSQDTLLRLDRLTLETALAPSGRSDRPTRIVDALSLSIRRGERVALVGASGSGKTMTALAIAGLLPRGVVQRGGSIMTAAPRSRLRTAMIFQDTRGALQPIRRIGKQLDDVLRYAPCTSEGVSAKCWSTPSQRRATAVALLNEVGLHDADRVLRAYPAQLSGGMCQRVLIALALARQPHLLLADEPTTGLDAANQQRVMSLINDVARARHAAVLLITHDLSLAVDQCDRIVVMRAGRGVDILRAADIGTPTRHRYTRALWAAHRLAAFTRRPVNVDDETCNGDVVPASLHGKTDQSTPSLQLRAIRKGYAGRWFQPRAQVLDAVDLTMHRGEIVGLTGPSGSGKTTLGRIVARLLTQDSGHVLWNDIDLCAGRPSGAARAPWRHAVQYVHQDACASLDPLRSVGDILSTAAHLSSGIRHIAPAFDIDTALREVGLSPTLRHRRPHQLSGGEAARVALARTLARRPELLVLDEPTAALDALTRARILKLMHRLVRSYGLTVLCISHDVAALRALCDRIMVLQQGRLVMAASF